jgi:hypothetical protein
MICCIKISTENIEQTAETRHAVHAHGQICRTGLKKKGHMNTGVNITTTTTTATTTTTTTGWDSG